MYACMYAHVYACVINVRPRVYVPLLRLRGYVGVCVCVYIYFAPIL